MITQRALRFLRTTDVGLSVFLVMIVVFVFVLPPFGLVGIFGRVVIDIFFSLMLISGVTSVSERKIISAIVTGITVIALVFRWTGSFVTLPALQVLDYVATTVVILLFCMVILIRVLKPGPITFRRIEGAVAVYLLLGLVWAYAYELIAHSDPGAFSGAVAVSGSFSSWAYFSFVTLATLGYGDISPVHPVARSLATAEAITGQLYLAILIARLVSQELYKRQQKPEG
ncbi:MAG: ion channel [Syntrophorhabdaceae bacterium]